jgi:hypothetical protein
MKFFYPASGFSLFGLCICLTVLSLGQTAPPPSGEAQPECQKYWLRDEDSLKDKKMVLALPVSIDLLSSWFGVEWNEDYTLNMESEWYKIFREENNGLYDCCDGEEFLCGKSSVNGGGEILWDYKNFKILGRVLGALKKIPGGEANVDADVEGIWHIDGNYSQDVNVKECAKTEKGNAVAYISFSAHGTLDLSLLNLTDSSCRFGFEAHGGAVWTPTSFGSTAFPHHKFHGVCYGYIYAKLNMIGQPIFEIDESVSS